MIEYLHDDTLMLLSRAIIILTWFYAVLKMWRFRFLPHVNHALAGALAIVLCQTVLAFKLAPPPTTMFFCAAGHLTLGISFVRLALALAHATSGSTEKIGNPIATRMAFVSTALGVLVSLVTMTVFGG